MNDLAIGDKVRFTDTVVKTKDGDVTKYESAGLPGFLGWRGAKTSEFNEGFIVRKRVLHDYFREWEADWSEYSGKTYGYWVLGAVPKTARLAYEVAWHINRKPVLVLASDLERI